MGKVSLGSTDIKLVASGSVPTQRISLGTTEIWTAKLLRVLLMEDFTIAGSSLTSASNYPFWMKRMSYGADNYQVVSAGGSVYRTGSGGTDSSDGSDFYYHRTPIPNQPWAQLRITTWGSFPAPGLVLFAEATGTQLYAQMSSTSWRIYTGTVGGSKTDVVPNGSHSFPVGDVLQFFVDRDGYLTLKYGENVLSRTLLSSISNLPTGRMVGFSMGRGTNRATEFRAGTTSYNGSTYKINADYQVPLPVETLGLIPLVAQYDSIPVGSSGELMLPGGNWKLNTLFSTNGYRSDFTDIVIRTSAGDQTIPFNAPDSSGVLDATLNFTVPAAGSAVQIFLKSKSTNTGNRTIKASDFVLTIEQV